MQFNRAQQIGLMTLIVIIAVLQFIIIKVDFSVFYNKNKTQEELLLADYYNNKIDSLSEIHRKETSARKYFKFNPNKLSYNSWKYLGLNTQQLYLLDSFRAENIFHSSGQVKTVLEIGDSLYNTIDTLMYFPKEYIAYDKIKLQNKIEYKSFNPNNFEIDDWKSYGFSEKQSEVIVNYGKRKGGYKSKEELKEVFVISEEKYNKMEEHILLPDITVEEEEAILDLNLAGSSDFKKIDGIGEVYSVIIVEYREKLGGFKYYYQLNEIKGLDSSVISDIRKTFGLSKAYELRKVNINTATIEEIQNHPYISNRLANEIVYFRNNFRAFKSVEEIRNIEEISDSYFNKIHLYLEVD